MWSKSAASATNITSAPTTPRLWTMLYILLHAYNQPWVYKNLFAIFLNRKTRFRKPFCFLDIWVDIIVHHFNLTFLGFCKEIRIHTHFYKCFHGGCFPSSYLECSSNPAKPNIQHIFNSSFNTNWNTQELQNQPKAKVYKRPPRILDLISKETAKRQI